MDILIKNVLAVDPQCGLNEITDIGITDGKISLIGATDESAERVIDAKGKLAALPGLFDMHVHFRDPGQTHKEDIFTGAAAAKAGGFTGVACMPNTKPVIDNAELVKYVLDKGQKTGIDVLPIGCVTKGMQSRELCDYDELKAAGVCALSDDGRPVENAELMRQALEKSLDNGLAVLSHCEDMKIINGGIINKGEVSQKLGVKGMDRASEDSITAREIALAMSCGGHIHICHVSTRGSVNIIRAAKKDGVNVTCETAPHYFTFTDEKLLSRDADYRMSPPLRTEDDRQAVEEAVLDGTIDCIITDHAPHSADEKADFETAPNGVVGLETSLAATLTKLYHTGKCGLDKIAQLMSIRPRQILGIPTAKIAVGERADLAIIDLDYEWEVVPEQLHSKSKNSVFKGERLMGKNLYTICKGKVVFEYQSNAKGE
ncbi:dihydroorotase [Ruminococcus sp. FC2018]|uniref:dihydroorotase n=1 Tax=Ruminococcus sp. FC2018 TaxID=1410617 RepID=UPI00048AB946|nr:dihydroorotase [Ruminococcus sp. FC2018]